MDYFKDGEQLRYQIKNLVYSFMKDSNSCKNTSEGMKQAEIFRECGLDWGTYDNATSSNQQYWLVALLRQLEAENKLQRDPVSKKWRLV